MPSTQAPFSNVLLVDDPLNHPSCTQLSFVLRNIKTTQVKHIEEAINLLYTHRMAGKAYDLLIINQCSLPSAHSKLLCEWEQALLTVPVIHIEHEKVYPCNFDIAKTQKNHPFFYCSTPENLMATMERCQTDLLARKGSK